MLGQPLRLEFARARYGPYAEQVHYVLQALEGHYVVGYGDRSAKVTDLEPIRPTEGSANEASERIDAEAAERVDALLNLVDGFETPYSLELLATAHFAAHHEPPSAEANEISARVASWNLRKARLFTPRHVAIAIDRLSEREMLPT